MHFSLTILGVSAAHPAHGRHPTAQVLDVQDRSYLIDCGEGTQMQFAAFALKPSRIHTIFISHLHGDHFLGLIGLLTSWGLNGRQQAVNIFAPPGLEEIVQVQLRHMQTQLPYPLRFTATQADRHYRLYEDAHLEVWTLPLKHRIPTTGFLFKEKELERNILPEKIDEYKMDFETIRAVKRGADLLLPDGGRVPNAALTKAPPFPRSFAYCSDTAYVPELAGLIKGVHLLYHEATFSEALKERAAVTMHATASQAASLASQAGAERLILGHYSSRYTDLEVLRQEAAAIFPGAELGREGVSYFVPFRK